MNTLGLNLDLKVGDRVKTPCGHWGTISDVRVDGCLYFVEFDYDTPRSIEYDNCFHADGRQAFPGEGKATRIDPIQVAPDIQVGDKLRLLVTGGCTSSVIALTPEGSPVVQSPETATCRVIDPTTLKDTDGDQWEIVKPAPTVTTFRNVYADGSLGDNDTNRTFEHTLKFSKIGRTRIAILRQDTQDGAIVSAEMIPTDPQLRTSSNPDGINPFS